jgi:hypothetical protein
MTNEPFITDLIAAAAIIGAELADPTCKDSDDAAQSIEDTYADAGHRVAKAVSNAAFLGYMTGLTHGAAGHRRGGEVEHIPGKAELLLLMIAASQGITLGGVLAED